MKRILLLVIYLTSYTSMAQSITILDADSKFPISNVVVFNEDKSKKVISDKNGIANISDFAENDILSFIHISYIEFEVLKRQIPKTNIVYLSSSALQLEEVFLSASK
ncbi:MAG TPA: hypothetical protein ENK46_06750, partial [Flavobacteriia bacterium]|nr:hypothetical protein [Flavobacteriia bacterium]